jgi:hypothetical protein
VAGYAALGNSAPSNILLGFEGAPVAVTILANLMVLTHMLSAYQVLVLKHAPSNLIACVTVLACTSQFARLTALPSAAMVACVPRC